MKEGIGYLDKERSGKSRHRDGGNEVLPSETSLSQPQPKANEVADTYLTGNRLTKKHKEFVRSISKEVPEGFDFDSNRIPPGTLAALENAGLKINPFERGDKHFIEVHDGEKTQVITHKQAVEWLQNLNDAYAEDARKLREREEEIKEIAELERILDQNDASIQVEQSTNLETEQAESVLSINDAVNDKIFEQESLTPLKDLIEAGISDSELLEYIREHPEVKSALPPEPGSDIVLSAAPKPFSGSNSIDKIPSRPNEEILDTVRSDVAEKIAKRGEFLRTTNRGVEDAKYIERSGEPVRPIVLKALSIPFPKMVEVSSDGRKITLQREGGEPFEILAEDASRMIALESEKTRLRKIKESTATDPDYVDTVPSALTPQEPEGTSLDDPMIKQNLNVDARRASKKLDQLNTEIANRVRREGEENENSVSAFAESEVGKGDSVIGGMYDAETGIGFDPSQPQIPTVDSVPAVQLEKSPKPKLTREEMHAHLERVKNKSEHSKKSTQEFEDTKADGVSPLDFENPNEYIVASGGVKPKKPHLNNAESIAYLKDVQEKRKRQREALEQFQPEIASPIPEPSVGVTPEGLDKLDIDLSERGEDGVDINLPLVPFGKENPTVLTDVVESPTVNIDTTIVSTELPKPPVTSAPERVVAPVRQRQEQAVGRAYENVQKDIALLERAKSEVAYGSKELFARFPEYKKLFNGSGGDRDAATMMWVERKLRELKAEGKESALTAPNFVDERFEKRFGITQAELSKIEGFNKLSNGQKMLVYENLREYAEQESRGEAAAMWASVRSIMGQSVESAPRKDAVGIEEYRGFLSKLILSTALHGPKIHVENGKLMTDFVGMYHRDRGVRPEQKGVVDALNSAAHAFARIPASWQEDGNGVHAKNESKITTFFKETLFKTESRNQYRKYEAQQQAYEEAKRAFAEQLEATGVPREQIVRKLIDVDAKVHQLRFVETSPEATALLQSVPDKTFWQKVGGAVKAGGVYAALGTVGRTMTGSALGALSGPAVAATLAGTRAWNKTAAEQRERDRKAHTGTIDASEGALNIVPASHTVKTTEGPIDTGLTAKLEKLVTEYQNLSDTADPKDRTRLLNQLKARATYSQDKLKLNRIQFGDKKSFAVNQARFFEALANAQVLVVEEGTGSQSRTDGRLKNYLDYREGAINDRRHREARKRVAVASTVAAGMAVAGAYAAHEFIKSDIGGKAVEKVKDWFTWDTTPGAVIGDTIEIEGPSVPQGAEVLEKTMTASDFIERSAVSTETPENIAPLHTEEEFSSVKDMPELKEIPPMQGASVEAEVVAQATEAQIVPQSPTAAEKAEIARLFTEGVEKLPAPTALDIQGGRILETFFLKANVPPQAWVNVRDIPVRSFILDSMERGTVAQRTPSLVQLGKIFREAAKPPYNVITYPNETTEIYTHRVFTAISQAAKTHLNTVSMKELLYPNK